jgi:predicted nucleic acid-binding protein
MNTQQFWHGRSLLFSEEYLDQWRRLLARGLEIVPSLLGFDFPRDRKDLPVLFAAVSARADYLVTGDRDFEEADPIISPTRVVSVGAMAEILHISN